MKTDKQQIEEMTDNQLSAYNRILQMSQAMLVPNESDKEVNRVHYQITCNEIKRRGL